MSIDPAQWGIETRYRRVDGAEYDVPPSTIEAILGTMRATDAGPRDDGPIVLREGEHRDLGGVPITTEDGREVLSSGDLPLGYHQSAEGQMVIVAPEKCVPPPESSGGWALQLYATRSRQSWGIGDLGDLARFGKIATELGADTALVNPLHASLPGVPQEASPYFPSSRTFRNPLYIAIESVAGASVLGDELQEFINAGRALNQSRNIDRDAVWNLKSKALESIWNAVRPQPEFDTYLANGGNALWQYATFCAIVERHGRDWTMWPAELRHPKSPAVAAFTKQHLIRVQFHAWLQFLIEEQLQVASESIALMHDLAIGVDPHGADAWIWQDALALGMHVGVPPDVFSADGQDWSFPPLDPWRLRAMNYEPFIATVRANMAHGAALRIDHVMGLFRLFWMVAGDKPSDGAYVRYPSEDLLAIVALESHRSGAYVVGEDLGTVEDSTRAALARTGVLSYKLLWFEDAPPQEFPHASMAAVTTHDLPTIAGLWTGKDLEVQRSFPTLVNESANIDLREKVARWIETGDASVEEVTERVVRRLGESASAVVTATLEDALGCEERPNYPGTTKEYPNWSVALPVTVDDFESHDGIRLVSKSLMASRKTDG